jgi:hypothetical protein
VMPTGAGFHPARRAARAEDRGQPEIRAGAEPSSRLRQVGMQPRTACRTITFRHGDVEHARKIAAVMIGHRAIRSRFRCVPNWSLWEQKRVATGPVRGYLGVAARVFTESS